MQTIVSSFEYSPDEYNIVVMPSQELIQKIVQLQDQLKSRLGDAIWFMPSSSLHITVMEVICHTNYGDRSRKELFEQWHRQYNEIVREVLASCEPVTLHFSELVVSPAAIIVKTVESQQLNAIRSRLLSRIKLPEGTKMPPDITHCSIARYSKSIDLDHAQKAALDLGIECNELVAEFKLMNDLVPPDFNPKHIETYSLKI